MEVLVEGRLACPVCGETIPLAIDTSQRLQTYVEDCPVCCRPLELRVRCRPGEVLELGARHAG